MFTSCDNFAYICDKKNDAGMSKHVVESYEAEYINENGVPEKRTGKKVIELDTMSEPFYITFLNYVGWMYDIRGNVALNVMAQLMELAEFNTGLVNLSTDSRRRIMESVGISSSALSRAISVLESKGAIARHRYVNKRTGEFIESKCSYVINPEMFWKGDMKSRKKLVVSFRAIYSDDDALPEGRFSSTSTSGELRNFFDDDE